LIITFGVGKNQEVAQRVTINAGTATVACQEIIVAIFGRWASTEEIMQKLANPSSANSCNGVTLINKESGTIVYDLDVRDRDPDLINSVVSCGAGRLNTPNIEAVKDHTHYVVLTGPVESIAHGVKTQMEAAINMLDTVAVLVQELNGAVVHVATAGITHTPEAWVAMNAEKDNSALVNAFVQRIGGSGQFFSCGMHAFGYGDACLNESLPAADGAKVLYEFLLHSLTTHLNPQGTPFIFRPNSASGGFRAVSGPCQEWEPESAFYNRFGVWTLTRA